MGSGCPDGVELSGAAENFSEQESLLLLAREFLSGGNLVVLPGVESSVIRPFKEHPAP